MTAHAPDAPRATETPSGKGAGDENFPVGSWLIRPDARRHVHAFYGFARASDDVADNPMLEAKEKISRLDRFAAVLCDKADAGDDVPSAVHMRESLRETGITPQHCLDLLTAFRRDAIKLRYKDWDDLVDYCRYSAAPVGRFVLALHGTGEEAWPANDALCSTLQIINHMQDCTKDYAALDRVYIPQDMLAARGAAIGDIAAEQSSAALRATFDDMLGLLGPMLKQARMLPRQAGDMRLRIETSIICVLADDLVKLLARRDPLADNVKLGKPAAALAALRGLLTAWL
ncbi:MAG: squalene synthase HpnC [Alphaproteobacteria bacterium]|nr:squalene synthase HpnC [Alphaproteobacteria bacterium]